MKDKLKNKIYIMPSKIWDKYKKIKEIESNSNIKTYIVSIQPIIKEIIRSIYTNKILQSFNNNKYTYSPQNLTKKKEEK